ncbi:MAG: hypothetical protein R2838_07760 [Caldilineaceae bacterium]
MAVHFEHAGDPEKATAYRLLAGQQALDTYALPDAIWHYEQAQTLAAERTVQVDAYFGLARAHFAADQLDDALTSILQALQLVEGHDPRAASLFLLQAEILFACYEVDAAESAARAAQQAAETMGEQEAICRAFRYWDRFAAPVAETSTWKLTTFHRRCHSAAKRTIAGEKVVRWQI